MPRWATLVTGKAHEEPHPMSTLAAVSGRLSAASTPSQRHEAPSETHEEAVIANPPRRLQVGVARLASADRLDEELAIGAPAAPEGSRQRPVYGRRVGPGARC